MTVWETRQRLISTAWPETTAGGPGRDQGGQSSARQRLWAYAKPLEATCDGSLASCGWVYRNTEGFAKLNWGASAQHTSVEASRCGWQFLAWNKRFKQLEAFLFQTWLASASGYSHIFRTWPTVETNTWLDLFARAQCLDLRSGRQPSHQEYDERYLRSGGSDSDRRFPH